MTSNEEIYQKVLKRNWNSGDMNNLVILGAFGRDLIIETKKEELEFLYKEIKHIEWARKNGMSATIYDDFMGTFRRRIKELKGALCSPLKKEEKNVD